jgi:hypothetical protein
MTDIEAAVAALGLGRYASRRCAATSIRCSRVCCPRRRSELVVVQTSKTEKQQRLEA